MLNIEYIIQLRDQFSQNSRRFQSEMRQMRRATQQVAQSTAAMSAQMEMMCQKINKAGQAAQSSSKKLGFFGEAVKKVRWHMMNFSAMALSMVAPFAFTQIIEYSQAINGVEAVTTGATERIKELRDLTYELGSTSKFSASEIAGGMKFMGMAGMDATEVLASMADVTNLAAAASIDLASSADIVTNIMRGYGIETEGLTKAVDMLSYTFTNSNTDLTQLGVAMKYAGPVAHSMGMAFSETAAIMGKLGDAGIQGSMAGTSVRNMIMRLVSPTKNISKAFKKLNIEMFDSQGQFIGLLDALDLLEKKGVSRKGMLEIFGIRGGPAAQVLLNETIQSVREFQKEHEKQQGTAAEIARKQMQGLYGQWEHLKKSVTAYWQSMSTEDGAMGWFLSGALKAMNDIAAVFGMFGTLIGYLINRLRSLPAVLTAIPEALGWLKKGTTESLMLPAMQSQNEIAKRFGFTNTARKTQLQMHRESLPFNPKATGSIFGIAAKPSNLKVTSEIGLNINDPNGYVKGTSSETIVMKDNMPVLKQLGNNLAGLGSAF